MAQKAKPTRKRVWFDPRLAIGIVLIAASVIGVFGIVSAADASDQVLTARAALAPGDRIDAGDLVATAVRMPGATDLYLVPNDVPAEGLIVTKAIAAGELVPASAVGSAAALRLASVVIAVSGELPGSIEPGATVDVWAARLEQTNAYGPPSVIVAGATVVRVLESEALVTSGNSTTIELLVPRSRIARVLEALANEDALSLIPSAIPVKG